ncbi:RING-H2 finger protein ATL11-like [Chenopodium quinoa]|uniref:RING-type E3 ubiquitin transferase n=1 Tax=Chenopodium quinoa TaxID=63459 RepID=A0A803KPC5_CHEQI|nr:RING-H2 finger protein ATL11-like [Chenopodium quinoa]
MQFLALVLVAVEIIICFLIYFGCVYIRQSREQCKRRANTGDPNNVGSDGHTCGTKNILVFVPYSAVKTFLGKSTVMNLTCTNCLRVIKDEDETLRLIPTCGHVYHTMCLVDPCSPSCPHCQAQPKSDGPDSKLEGGEGEEVLEIKVVEEKMIRLSEEVTKKMILHAKLVLPTGKLCSPAQFLS